MGLFEFHVNLKKRLPKRTYNFLKGVYRKTIKYPQERRELMRKLKGNCDIWFIKELLKKGTKFPHPYSIIVSSHIKIGRNCNIFQGVTIGSKDGSTPELMNNVTLYSNAVVIGKVKIGNNSIVGANYVVLKDIPRNEIWAGNPAKLIKRITGKNE